jgi:hypothetical protein
MLQHSEGDDEVKLTEIGESPACCQVPLEEVSADALFREVQKRWAEVNANIPFQIATILQETAESSLAATDIKRRPARDRKVSQEALKSGLRPRAGAPERNGQRFIEAAIQSEQLLSCRRVHTSFLTPTYRL